ncbi:MAG: class I SAM-dependent methyltransferase [Bacteroidales bacterium]
MKVNTNTWNKIRYTLYTPGYDLVAGILKESRRKSILALNIQANDKVLIIGAGTGLDLEFLPFNCEIIATDITPSMISSIKKRNKSLNRNVQAIVMDGQSLAFPDQYFDKIILHLILAVIPDPDLCILEVERLLKPGGKVAVYDKFVRKNKKVSLLRKSINLLTNFMFSNITRHFETIFAQTKLTVVSDEDADFNGNFRLIQLLKL